MKVNTRNSERTIQEMHEIWYWMTSHFGPPSAHNSNLKRWTYGKEAGWTGSTLCDGVFDIEWFEFSDEKDATLYMLRWS